MSAQVEQVPRSPEGIIDIETFQQIRDMDEGEDEDFDDGDEPKDPHAFSRGIVFGYFEQAESTFTQMEEAIAELSLKNLSSLGHFLKGSSAALGIVKVQASCEKMQHYGNLRDEEVGEALTQEEALGRIKLLIEQCRQDYKVAKAWLVRLYSEAG